jgi:hypothetical protein
MLWRYCEKAWGQKELDCSARNMKTKNQRMMEKKLKEKNMLKKKGKGKNTFRLIKETNK